MLARRSVLRAGGLLAVTPAAWAHARPRLHPSPTLSEEHVVRCVAGLRPYRAGGVRIERERLGEKLLVHNYGHGGAGVTLSWGSAEEATALVPRAAGSMVAVAGAGVVGLTTAFVLLERGFRVRLYARERSPHTTSDLAGAEWAPDVVDPGSTLEERVRFGRMLTRSWRRFVALAGPRWGVWRRVCYEADGVPSGLAELPPGLIAPPERLVRLPFAAAHSGLAYRTLLIEPPRFLPALARAIEARGGVFVARSFASLAELAALPEPVIVNCLGLGAGSLLDDRALRPIKGQLVHLAPQPLPWLLDHPEGYVFPRSDALVLGGSFEDGRTDTTVDPAVSARILASNRRFFDA